MALRPFATMALLGALIGAFFVAPAQAEDATFPKGSRVGLVLPSGLELSRNFPGYEDSTNKVIVLVAELPAEAYDATLKAMQVPAGTSGVSNVKREILLTASGAAHLISGDQTHEGAKIRKWMMVSYRTGSDFTALVTAIVPDAAKKTYDEAAMRKLLATLSLREQVPDDEILSQLPFQVTDRADFKTIRAIAGGRGVLLSDEDRTKEKSADEPSDEAEIIVTANPGAPTQPSDRPRFAEQLMAQMPGIKDVRTVFSESMRIGTQPGYEIRLEAKSLKSGKDVNVVQWVRFGGGSFIHIVGISPRDKWPDAFTRFRAVRDGVTTR